MVAWGLNDNGQATVPLGLKDIVAISAGDTHSLALRADGTVVAWGDRSSFQAVVPPGLSNVVALAAGGKHTLALIGDGWPVLLGRSMNRIAYVGASTLLDGRAIGLRPLTFQWQKNLADLPGATLPALNLSKITLAAAGNYRVVVSNALGVRTAASTTLQVLDDAPGIVRQSSNQVVWKGSTAIIEVETSGSYPQTIHWYRDNALLAGRTGPILELDRVGYADAGSYQAEISNRLGVARSSPALLSVVPVAAWGAISQPWLTNAPATATDVSVVSAGSSHNLALRADGTVVAWGDNTYGQTNVPPGLASIAQVAAGGWHSLALRSDGTIVAWGLNNYKRATRIVRCRRVVRRRAHSLALRTNGTVVAWGENYSYQTNIPPGLSNVVAVSAGDSHNLALKSDGTVVAWGGNQHEESLVPIGLKDVLAVSAGQSHSLALRRDGEGCGLGLQHLRPDEHPDHLDERGRHCRWRIPQFGPRLGRNGA